MADKKRLGRSGEEAAARYLQSRGYTLLERNYRTRCGEIDLIALDEETLCFVEVKTRSSEAFGTPGEAVTPSKQKKLIAAANQYLIEHPQERICRFDVVEVMLRGEKREACRLIRGAFMVEGR